VRIEYLKMKNFAPIFVALEKTEVVLDYRPFKDKVINVMIGQMGSCKTFLLGHHQPFATLGTLDVRNQEDLVLAGKKGIKEIVYSKGDDLFEITHIYSPQPSGGHSVKSYIKKNGKELNENGNNGSFKVIIETEFGLDQNFLKLFRIGSNVINLPDMSASERKAFISSMLTDTEIFTYLYKKIGEENRSLNAQMTIIVNKLHAISHKTKAELQVDCDAEEAIVQDISKEVEALDQETYRIDGAMSALRGDRTQDEYNDAYMKLQAETKSIDDAIVSKQAIIDELDKYGDPKKLSNRVAGLNAQISVRGDQIMKLGKQVQDDQVQRDQLRDQLAVIGSEEHIEVLRTTYDQLIKTVGDYERQLRHFSYSGSMGSIINLTQELQDLNGMITDLTQYDAELLREILRNPEKAQNTAKHELEHLRNQQDKLYREMNNIKQGVMWQPTQVMVRPFNCPVPNCPFYVYHPLTEQKRNKGKDADKLFLEKQNAARELDAQIFKYEAVPGIVRKVQTVQAVWKRVIPQAQEIGVVKDDSLAEVVTNLMKRHWYDGDKLQRTRELCGVRDKYYEITQKIADMKNELAQYELSDVPTLRSNLEIIEKRFIEEQRQLEELESRNRADRDELERLGEAILQLSSIEAVKSEIQSLTEQSQGHHLELSQMEENLDKLRGYMSEFDGLKITLAQKKTEYRIHSESHDRLEKMIREIQFNEEQYAEILNRQQLVKDVLDAVSAKKGIPLAYVKYFLADCTDTLNDLISDVFEDAIEIQDFDIPEDGSEFNIPYSRNGVPIGDIIKSSQGERAIISLALSFALIRQGTFDYNIMLLDEVDGPLYKTAREKFITILFKQIVAIHAEQVFVVSHNNTFDGLNCLVIMTTDEQVDESPITAVMRI